VGRLERKLRSRLPGLLDAAMQLGVVSDRGGRNRSTSFALLVYEKQKENLGSVQ
jgi:hypothetical protein